jgi:hypothetical protein
VMISNSVAFHPKSTSYLTIEGAVLIAVGPSGPRLAVASKEISSSTVVQVARSVASWSWFGLCTASTPRYIVAQELLFLRGGMVSRMLPRAPHVSAKRASPAWA